MTEIFNTWNFSKEVPVYCPFCWSIVVSFFSHGRYSRNRRWVCTNKSTGRIGYGEEMCRESCGFTVHFCNIPANPLQLIFKHTIIYLCLSKLQISCQNLYFWWVSVIYFFSENHCLLWETLFSWKPENGHPNVSPVELWPFEPKRFWLFGLFWFYHPKNLGQTDVIF